MLSHENVKEHCPQKVIVFLYLRWRILLKVAAFVIFPTSIANGFVWNLSKVQ